MVNQRKFDPQAPLQEGEFQRIKGIAETTEKALHEAGIETFEELAMLSPQEIAGKLKGVAVLEKIIRLDWTGQAAEYAQQLAQSRLPAEKDEPQERQHYESFMVVLLLDDEHEVRRTKISYVQKGMEANWAGWDEPRLVNWIATQAQLAERGATARELAAVKAQALAEESGPGKPRKDTPQKLDGVLQLGKLQVIAPVSKRVRQTVCPGDSFGVRFKLDFSEVEVAQSANLLYRAEVQIHSIKRWKQAYHGQIEGQISPDDGWPYLETLVPGLPEGSYHLEVAVQVYPAGSSDPNQDGLFALTEGSMLRVTWEEPKPAKTDRREKSVTDDFPTPAQLAGSSL